MRKMLCLGIVIATTIGRAQAGTSDGLTAGAWEETYSIQMIKINGQPVPAAPPETSSDTDCSTDQDVADPRRVLLLGAEQDCLVSDFSMKSGKIRMAVSCTFASGMSFTGDLGGTYNSTAFEITGGMRSHGSAITEIRASMNARRVGVRHDH